MGGELTTRAVRDDDADGLIALVGACYAEYPGCVLDLPGIDADLRRPATAAAERGGRWWVVEAAGAGIVATIAAGGVDETRELELQRLYVARSHRRRGLGSALVDRVEARAVAKGARRVVLGSDTRFHDAHRLYQRLGYVDTGERRELHDPSQTTEIIFARRI